MMRATLAASLALLCGARAVFHNGPRASLHARSRQSDSRAASRFSEGDLGALENALACDVCAYSEEQREKSSSSEGYPRVDRAFSCPKVWLRLVSACPAHDWPPPKDIPADMVDAFTMHGKARTDLWYFEQRYSGGDAAASDWDARGLPARIAAATPEGAIAGINSYTLKTPAYVDAVLANHTDVINGGVGIVWGSERPWAEVLLARRGAKMTLTVEYGRTTSTHATVRATTPQRFGAFMLQHDRRFDFAFTYSSLEHSGLGRYGDALNPYGDLEAVAQTWCALKPGGLFFLGLPSGDAESSIDVVVWNAHRYYGPHRLSQLFAGYEHVHSYRSGSEPQEAIIHVLRKPL
jgi:hypothetical protein